ncbi:protein kinase, partial [bacterium]|nr:protein kinase [bacterium]
MALQVGIRLGPYEIQAAIGAGGMGEVYRAKDTRLDRTVAIKIIPSHLSNNSDLKQRFEREARTISSLNHPNICALYDIGNQDGIDFLVMEFLDGETLAERLSKGSLPLDQVFRYGIQIADALDKAHKQGIIHRDLKPGNIMLTKSGIKLLDFGLAKLQAAAAQPLLSGVSALPTEHHDLTAEGTILGTIQYMSPEQLETKETDARTDIFALGTILYEMATRKKAFSGRSQASLIAAILSSDPAPVSTSQPISPMAFDRIVTTCLAKDPEDRWQTAHDVMLELKWVAEERTSGQTSTTFPRIHKWRERVAWGAACIFLITTLVLSLLHFRNNVPQQSVYRLSINPPENFSFSSSLSLSPNGQHLAFTVTDVDGTSSLWVRRLDSLSSQRLPGTDDAVFPFWSPDGNSLGFFADGKLKRIEIAGGPPVILADASNDPRGGTWNRSDEILFSPGFQTPIYCIGASGGKATQLTTLNKERQESSHRWPLFLPDGQHFL